MGGSPARNPAVAKTLGSGHTLLPAHTQHHPAGPQHPRPACVGCVCAGAPGPGLWVRTGADGAQLTPSQGANGRKWRGPLATNTHRRSLTHRHIQHTRGCTYTSACVHVCAHVMTHALHQSPGHGCSSHSRRPGPGSPLSSLLRPRGSQAQPGSHALRCVGDQLESLGAPRPGWDTAPPPRPPPHRGPCLDGSTASGQPPAPQPSPHSPHSLLCPPRGPPVSSRTLRLPLLSSHHVTTPVPTPVPPSVCLLGGHLSPPTCLWQAQPCHGDPRLQRRVSDHHKCGNGRRGQAWVLQENAAGRE